jgi:isoleucyl-tRNA synthetase
MHAYRTLRYVLVQLCKVAAPFTPFISETIYRNLKGASMPNRSTSATSRPPTRRRAMRRSERSMALVQTVVRLGRQLRTENDLKVRQPLSVLHVVSANPEIRAMLEGSKS